LIDVLAAESEKKEYNHTMEKIISLSTERNIVAHEAFGSDEKGDGVRFYVFKASGKVSVPDVRWSADEFFVKFDKMKEYAQKLKAIRTALTKTPLAEAIRNELNSPNEELVLATALSLLAPISEEIASRIAILPLIKQINKLLHHLMSDYILTCAGLSLVSLWLFATFVKYIVPHFLLR
jgi:hypothetical protein